MWAGHFLLAPLDSLSNPPHLALCPVTLTWKRCISELTCPLDFTCLANAGYQWEMGWGGVAILLNPSLYYLLCKGHCSC